METLQLLVLLGPEKMRGKLHQMVTSHFPDAIVHTAGDTPSALTVIGKVDALFTFGSMMSTQILEQAPRLKWIHSLGTGVDGICDNPALKANVTVTATRGIHGPVMAEMAFCMMLALSRDLPRNIKNKSVRKWDRWPAALLFRKKVGILGVGLIAGDIASRCKAFGMHVTGISRTPRSLPSFDRMVDHAALPAILAELDYLILTIPYAPESHHMVNAEFLAKMKPGSFLVNIARGGIVDEEALATALKSGHIAGAGLDVFSAEPLPADNPLWELDNVIITAHQGGFSNTYLSDAFPQLERNLKAFLALDMQAMEGVVQHQPA